MKSTISIVLFLILIIVIVAAKSTFFVVPEGKQVIITQFGKPIRSIRDAGLSMKLPFIQDVRMLEKRILNWDGTPTDEIPTKDKKFIFVDTTARWQIVDPIKFIMALVNERKAADKISAIIENATRDVIASHNLIEAVRNTNSIIDKVAERKQAQEEALAKGEIEAIEEEITGEIEYVRVGREALSTDIVSRAREQLKTLGVNLIDVQIKRVEYEESVERKVYARMISERKRIAEKIRSVGKGEKRKILGKTNKDLQEIESSAYKTVQEIKGRADAKAVKIYADAMGSNPSFYEFIRTIEAYQTGLRDDSQMILSAESEFLKLLREGSNFSR